MTPRMTMKMSIMGLPSSMPRMDNDGLAWKYVSGRTATSSMGYGAADLIAPGYLYSTTLTLKPSLLLLLPLLLLLLLLLALPLLLLAAVAAAATLIFICGKYWKEKRRGKGSKGKEKPPCTAMRLTPAGNVRGAPTPRPTSRCRAAPRRTQMYRRPETTSNAPRDST
jgi:hypothetical protein